MKRHINIPIFIPHLGCPNACVFCNQRSISGKREFHESDVDREISDALATIDTETCDVEIAFFGGSFTGIDRGLMERLLSAAKKYIDDGRVKSLRCSTRPDYIDRDILDILKKYGMTTIELGIQSTDDEVLRASKRGHTSADTKHACRLIKEYGFSLVGQMMIALPHSTEKSELETARAIIELGADGARIYPTMVFAGTELSDMTLCGDYIPPDAEEQIRRTAAVAEEFVTHGVKLIRVGLCAAENLYSEDGIVAGAYHPAMGEICEGEIYYERISKLTQNLDCKEKILTVRVPRGETSKAIGHGGRNKKRLREKLQIRDMKVIEDDTLDNYRVKIEFR